MIQNLLHLPLIERNKFHATCRFMNTNPIFDTIQEFVSQGDTGQALQTFIAFLEKEGTQPDALRDLRVVEGNYNTARRKENNGILNFAEARSEYAKANEAVLLILEAVAAGRKPSSSPVGMGQEGRARLPWLIGGAVLLLLGIVAGVLFTRPKGQKANQNQVVEQTKGEELKCPTFRADRFKIMIVQFQNLGEGKRTPELSIQSRIRELTTNNQLATDVEILSDKKFESSTPDQSDAADLGKNCQADMVIWGQFEPLAENAISVDISYAFTNSTWPPGTASQTFKNVSEIKADRMKINKLDEAVFRICTALALRENRIELAEKWLNKLENPNPREQRWKEMLKRKR